MADFTDIIQEINTNLPDNTSQSITAEKLRTTLIDLTEKIDDVQDDFETTLTGEFDTLENNINHALDNLVVDNLTSHSTYEALAANQGRVLNEKINDLPYTLNEERYSEIDLSQYQNVTTATIRYTTNLWDNSEYDYNAFKLIPVSPGRTFEVKANATLSSQVTFLKSDTVEVGTTPDYAGDITIVSSIPAGETRRFTAPEDAVYMYVLIQQTDYVTYYRTPQYVRLIQPAYIQQSKIVDNLDSTDNTTVLSGALGPALKPSVEAGKPINLISPLGGMKIDGANLYFADNSWVVEAGRSCTMVDIQGLGIKKIQVYANSENSTHFGFVSDFEVPQNGVEGLENTSASIIGSIYTLAAGLVSNVIDVPNNAKFIYFNLSGVTQSNGSRQSYIPNEVVIVEQDSNIDTIIPSWDDNYEYDTCIEENITNIKINSNYRRTKLYKIDHNAEYYVIIYGLSSYGSTVNGIVTYDSSMNVVRTLTTYNWGNGVSLDKTMDPITFQDNEEYVKISYYSNKASGAYGYVGKGAIMRKLKNDSWVPTNNLIYCVSKIKSPTMPYNYSEEETIFSQTDKWSAWNFVMPYNYNRTLFTNKKFPICTFFHGSSGWDSPDNMGYSSSENVMFSSKGYTLIGMLREAGFVVFDINGYGVSYQADDNSRHWGNPMAVATVKKAYEVLVDRFNCRRGMAISGISMGGAITKSYCMTYPEDVVVAAPEAPSEIGGTCRFSVTGRHVENQSQTSAAHAWGYENAMAMYADNEHTAFIGYSPCIAPNVIDENGFIKKIVQTEWNEQNDVFANKENFSCNFPVEIKIWHGDADTNVPLEYSQWFVNTIRNSNGNATLRLCPNCVHDLNNYPWVRQEVVNYIVSKMKL